MLAAVCVINVVIDPYLRFGTPRMRGLSQYKPEAIGQVRMAKTYGVCRDNFRTLFLGNSRVDVGLSPQSEFLPTDRKPAYNLGQPGTGTEVASLYFDHAVRHYCPTTAIIGVDFLSFLEESDRPNIDLAADKTYSRLDSSQESGSWKLIRAKIQDAVSAALSLSATTDSFSTMARQHLPPVADLDEHGFNSGDGYLKLIRVEGQHSLFRQKNEEVVAKCQRRFAPDFNQSSEIEALDHLMKKCRESETETIVFIHPYHADLLDIFFATGQWDEFEAWKRDLAQLCESHGVALWDFAYYCDPTTEPVPHSKDRQTVMNGYWESGHYRNTLGAKMMRRMFSSSDFTSFGVQLTSENFSQHLEMVRLRQQDYWSDRPGNFERIRKLVTKRTR